MINDQELQSTDDELGKSEIAIQRTISLVHTYLESRSPDDFNRWLDALHKLDVDELRLYNRSRLAEIPNERPA